MIDVSTAKSTTLNGSDVTKITEGGVVLWEKKTPITSPLRVVNNVAGSAITVTLTRNGNPADINVEYSTNNVNWTTWTETNGVRSMSIAQNGNLFLRGNNPNGLNPTNSDTDYYSFTADKKYAMAGDIRSLISRYEIDTIPTAALSRFFKNSTTLDNASYMRLEATNLGTYAYSQLFYGCTDLKLSPHLLPATNVSGSGYDYMFCGCSALEVMPIISATDFGNNACRDMFYGCSALTQQWVSATVTDSTKTNISFTIASSNSNAFKEMFRGCTSLVNASGITATKTTEWHTSVFAGMFNGCTSLTSTPTITIGSLASGTNSHCHSMFNGCTSLTTVNMQLNATTLYYGSYKLMFSGCTSLVNAPEIKATTLSDGSGNTDNGSLAYMFQNCSKLASIKVHFTSWNSGSCTKNWTYGTKSTGTFYKPSSLPSTKNASGNTTNPHYIPYDWTVVLNPCVDCTNWQQCGYVSEEECEFDLYGTLNQLVTGGLDTRQESGGTVYKLNVYIRTGVPGCTYTIREAGGSTHTYSGSGDNSLYNYVVDRVSLVNGKKHFYVNATKDGISTGEIHYAAYDYGIEIIE